MTGRAWFIIVITALGIAFTVLGIVQGNTVTTVLGALVIALGIYRMLGGPGIGSGSIWKKD